MRLLTMNFEMNCRVNTYDEHVHVDASYSRSFCDCLKRYDYTLLKQTKMKKALRETQTLRAGCGRWSQKLSPLRIPLPGGGGPPKFNQLEMVTTCTNRPSLVKIDARNFELSWQQTPPARPPARPLQTGPITIHCADS